MASPARARVLVFLCAAVFALLAAPSPAAAQTAQLAPQQRLCDPAFQDCRADILTYINQETVEIDMGFWMMTDARYANALVAAWQRGVKIRLLMDTRCVDQHEACGPQNDQLAAAGIPMRNRLTSGILHWKMIILVGQGQVEFAGANYAPFEMSPTIPYVNYTDEIVAFTDDPGLVHSFMTKFDDLWTSTTEFADYANITAPLTRSFATYPIDPELNFPPDDSYRDRAVAAYNAENQQIDVLMFRITDWAHPSAMMNAVQRGVPVRLITDETEYRNPERLWDAYYVDEMYANGVQVRFDGHQGIDHEKAVILYGSKTAIFGSSNWTEPSSDTQREHNMFTQRGWVYDFLTAQFERKWNNTTGYAETKPFVPLPPDVPVYQNLPDGSTGVPATGASLVWYAGVWAHKYDIYLGTSPNPPLLERDDALGPSRTSTDDRSYALPALRPATTYYWKIVSKTMADVSAAGPVRSFTTAGTAPAANAAPSVSITAPSPGTPGQEPLTLNLSAAATDTDGTIRSVDFYANATYLGTSHASPFSVQWTNAPAGTYSLTAVATDDQLASTTSAPVSVTVAAAAAPTITRVRGPYLQQPTDHSMVVVWATRETGQGEVQFSTGGGAASTVTATARLVPATTTGLAYDYYQYEAILPGLSPATVYSYQALVSGVTVAPAATFRTAPQTGAGNVSFVAFGDSGTGSTEQHQLATLMSNDTFDLALHAGDIAYGSSDGTGAASYATYQSYFFDVYDWLSRAPFMPVEGNHDSRATNNNGQAYLDLFSLPANGATAAFPDDAERFYSFDYGPVHFVALDTEFAFLDPARQAEQLKWLDADLAATTQPWKVAILHRAPYSSGGEHGSSLDVQAAFGPIFERYGVDLVLAGHEHDYERTVPIKTSTVSTDRAVPYVVTGGGGAPLYPAGTSSWTAFSTSAYEYVKVTADACTLTLNTIGIDDTVMDTSTMTHCAPDVPPVVSLTAPADGATFAAPAPITLTASASDSDGAVVKVDFYAGTTLVGTASAAPYAVTWSNPAAGSYSVTAVATDDRGATTTSPAVGVTVTPPQPLPAGWTNADIGVTGAVGSTSWSAGTFSVTGAGADVWGTADALQYAYTALTGDGTIVARVASEQNVANWTKAGVMIRGSLSPASAQAFMLVSPGKGVAFQRRLSDGASSVNSAGSFTAAPRWVKLVRAGNTISAFESPDGLTWTQVGTADTFALGTTVDVGLAVSSHVAGTLATAAFDNVTVSAGSSGPPPNVPPSVTITSPAGGATFTAPAAIALTASASDTDGSVARVDFYAGTTLLGSVTSAPYSLNWSNVPAGTYSLTAVAIDNAGASTTSSAVVATVSAATPASTLPSGWSNADVGTTGAPGTSSWAAGTFSVTGAGADVWNTADALQYAYTTLTGDGTIVARVATVQSVANWTKAGVMIRNSLSPGAAQAFMLVSAGKGVAFQRRVADDASSVSSAGSFTTAPRWVKLTRTGNTIAAFESADGITWTSVGTDTFTMGSAVDVGLAVSSHVAGTVATATFDNVTVTTGAVPPPSTALPDGWSGGDVGATGAPGSSTFTSGTFSVTGAGADVWNTSDAFQYACTTLTGDGSIVARVAGVQYVANWTKAGVMIRNSLSPSSAQAFMLVSAGKGLAFQRRLVDADVSVNTAGPLTTAPYWVKLKRAGDVITAFVSPDGTTWTEVGSDTFTMGPTVQIGLAVSSHVTGTPATATFDHVNVTPGS